MCGEYGNTSNNSFNPLNSESLLDPQEMETLETQGDTFDVIDNFLLDHVQEGLLDPNPDQQRSFVNEENSQINIVDPFDPDHSIFDSNWDPNYFDPLGVVDQGGTDPYIDNSYSWFDSLSADSQVPGNPYGFEASTIAPPDPLHILNHGYSDPTAPQSLGPYYLQPTYSIASQGSTWPATPHPQQYLEQRDSAPAFNSTNAEPYANGYGPQFIHPYQTSIVPPSLYSSEGAYFLPTSSTSVIPTAMDIDGNTHPGFPGQGTSTTVHESSSTANTAGTTSFDYFAIAVGSDTPRTCYVIEPDHDSRYLEDFTGFMPDQAWLSEDNLPPALGMLEPIFKFSAEKETIHLDRSVASGPYVPRLMFNHILPSRISWKVEGWRTAYWKSLDSRITNDDIIDRMFWTTYIDSENSACPYTHRVIIRAVMNERERKWRMKGGGLARREGSKGRVSQDSLVIMERMIQNADATDPNSVWRTCLYNTVWKVDFKDMTMVQPKPVFAKNRKNKTENYLGQKFPLPQAKTKLSDRVMKVFNRVNELREDRPNMKPTEAQGQTQKLKNNWAKRMETIKANKDSGRSRRAPHEPKKGKGKVAVSKQSGEQTEFYPLLPLLPRPPLESLTAQVQNDTASSPQSVPIGIVSEGSRKRKRKDVEEVDQESPSKSSKSDLAVKKTKKANGN